MRSKILLYVYLTLALPLAGQVPVNCDPVVFQRLDSVINYVRVGQTDVYTPAELFIYNSDVVSDYQSVDKFTLPSREPVNRQNYFFSYPSVKANYILQEWGGTGFSDRSRTDYYYRPDGLIEREVFSNMEGGQWKPYQQHIYNYDGQNVISTYLRQMMYSPGVWTDYSYKNYIYDDQARLIERNEQRIADGVIFWVELFTYDDAGKVSIRIRQTLKYLPATRTYGIVNLSRQLYSYDRYGELSGYLSETWTNNEWLPAGKSIYYRTILKDKEIPVCYKGQTIIVPVRVAVRLFERGALPGRCECLFPDGMPEISMGNGEISPKGSEDNPPKVSGDIFTKVSLSVYPNPASSEITVVYPRQMEGTSEISIYSHGGRLFRREITGNPQETLDISDLKPGSYYLVVAVDGEVHKTSFVKKH